MRHVTCQFILYKQKQFSLSTNLFVIYTIYGLLTSWKCATYVSRVSVCVKAIASVKPTESLQSVNFLFYLLEYLSCCDLEAHQNWILGLARLRGSTNTCGAVTDLCVRAACSSTKYSSN